MLDHFGLIAPIYEHLANVLDPEQLRRYLNLPTSGRLLDAGGGTGRVGRALYHQAGQVVICDVSLRMLHQAVRQACLDVAQAPVETLPFADNTFGRIIVVDAFHHFADHQAAIASLWRVLAPGGRLVIEEPNIDTPIVKFVGLAERAMLMRSHFFSPRDMAAMLEAVGGGVSIFKEHAFNSWIVADKAAL